ncbi:nucleotidyltransferase family protein [uncultured Thermanaerothrix sp.]|uniref:nucleotidyltransferase family protein n=1 Tax=uncultured Thermanaerothrix sp. TaxID=1195149 RepID=UPI002611B82A|nr:nucleotidyltransferase family protein [uncultured Thermanaerothrix sp.]
MGARVKIGAVVLAAGLSRRMGAPKLLLPWGERTVLEQVVVTLREGGVEDIWVVTGGYREQVENLLRALPFLVHSVHNPDFSQGEMISSLKIGLKNLPQDFDAALIVLGDQPQIQKDVISRLLNLYAERKPMLIVPSYQMRRGHPWLVDRRLWDDLIELSAGQTLRDFLALHANEIDYLVVDTPSVIQDLDTPEDYARMKPSQTLGKN